MTFGILSFILVTRNLLDFVDERLHLVGALAFHLGSDGGVDIHGGGNLGVAHILLKGLNLNSGSDCGNGVRMPLWHNKDKSETP